nr:reverse transcriptase domain-containing protein [Tanacetum cinerariifolium]
MRRHDYDLTSSLGRRALHTPFGESDFFLEEIEDFLNDDSIPTRIENSVYDPEGNIIFLEKLLNEDPFQLPSMDLKLVEELKEKSSIEEPLELELKELPSHLKEGIVLGHKISKSGIKVGRAKIDVIAKLPHPTTVKGVRSFLGHAGFYRRFIQDFSKIARLMTHLLEKETPFVFSKDAIDYAIGAVLGQRKSKHFQLIHYASKTMTEAQIHYTTTKKEMLAVVYAFEKFRPYHVLSKSIVYTDHSALKYLLNKQDAKPSDRGTHFCNDQFTRVMIKYGVTHRLATAYHPQTSGQVEVSNCGLKRILERTVGENRTSWSDKLDDALWAFHTAYKTSIGCTPYKLVYGKSCHLPIELEHRACWALKHVNFDLKIAGDHHKLQLNELSELRDQAYENSVIYKERTKKLHDSKIKNRIFNVGDQVLLFNSRLNILSRKLKTRWSGPFTITRVFPYGTIELSQPNGLNFKVNGHRVKHYFGGDIPSNVALDLHRIYPSMIEVSRVWIIVPVHKSFTSFV